MTNEDVKNIADYHSIPRESYDWICENYTEIKAEEGSPDDKWICICCKGNDFKYGRMMICIDKMLIRNLTFGEFYRGSFVD